MARDSFDETQRRRDLERAFAADNRRIATEASERKQHQRQIDASLAQKELDYNNNQSHQQPPAVQPSRRQVQVQVQPQPQASPQSQDAEMLGGRWSAVLDEEEKQQQRRASLRAVDEENRRMATAQRARAAGEKKAESQGDSGQGFWSKFGTGTR